MISNSIFLGVFWRGRKKIGRGGRGGREGREGARGERKGRFHMLTMTDFMSEKDPFFGKKEYFPFFLGVFRRG